MTRFPGFLASQILTSQCILISDIRYFTKQDCIRVGFKSKRTLIKMLKKAGIESKAWVHQPRNPEHMRWSSNEYDQRLEHKLYVDAYPGKLDKWNKLPDTIYIYEEEPAS